MASGAGLLSSNLQLFFILTFILGIIGALLFIIPKFFEGTAGIKHDNIFRDSNEWPEVGWEYSLEHF